jgi:hypothetical protein
MLDGGDKAAAQWLVRSVKGIVAGVKLHPSPSLRGWLMVQKSMRAKSSVRLCCPLVGYRRDIMRVHHDALGHCDMRQLLSILTQIFTWKGVIAVVQGVV